MKKLKLLLGCLAIAGIAFTAFANPPCARFTITPLNGALITVNGHVITGETTYQEGAVVSTVWNGGCVPYPGWATAELKGYVFVPPSTWAFSHAVDLNLSAGCESDQYILHTDAAVDCKNAWPSATPINGTLYCPCNNN